MNINVKTTNISMTPAIQDYLEKKLMMLDRIVGFDRDNVFVYAELGKTTNHHKSGDIFRAEINLKAGSSNYRAVAEQQDLYAAIDMAKDGLEQEVLKGKDKKQSVFRKGAQKLKNIIRFGREEV